MMQLECRVTDDVKTVVRDLTSDASKFAVIATLDGETTVLAKTVPRAESADASFAALRDAIGDLPAAFIFLAPAEKSAVHTVMLITDAVKPKPKMMYAACCSGVRTEAGGGKVRELRVSAAAEIVPSLFAVATEADRASLLTDAERQNIETEAQIQKELKEAPGPRALPSLGATAAPELITALKAFAANENWGTVVAVAPGLFSLEATIPKDATTEAVVALLPADAPRFAVFRSAAKEDEVFLAYVCPATAKPKDKMPYAASKASLVAAAESGAGVKVTKRVEVAAPSEIASAIKDALTDAPVTNDDAKPSSDETQAKKSYMQGPRMLMI